MNIWANLTPKPQRIIRRKPTSEDWQRILQEKQKLMAKEEEKEAQAGASKIQDESQFLVNNLDLFAVTVAADDDDWICDETWEKWENEASKKPQDMEKLEDKMDVQPTQFVASNQGNMSSNPQHELESDNNATYMAEPIASTSRNDPSIEIDDEQDERFAEDDDLMCGKTCEKLETEASEKPEETENEPESDNATAGLTYMAIPLSSSSHNDRFGDIDVQQEENDDKDVDNICESLANLHP